MIQEDWLDFVAAFYFPKKNKIQNDDETIREFIQKTNAELCEKG